jgi:hypothetical protein
MRLHLENLDLKRIMIKSLFSEGLGINSKMLFDLKYVEYEKQKGKMMVLCRCKWLKHFLTNIVILYSTKSYEVLNMKLLFVNNKSIELNASILNNKKTCLLFSR